MNRIFFSAMLALLVVNNVYGQTIFTSAATAGLKYPLLEVAVGRWEGWSPDADQDVREMVKPLYPRTIVTFWHCIPSPHTDPMAITGDPFRTSTGYIGAFPTATIDRAVFSSTVAQNRPWESKVGIRNVLTPRFNVTTTCSYNPVSRVASIQVTGSALTSLTGNWYINAYVIEDSISSGTSPAYNQANYLNTTGSTSCTGSASWYIGMGNPITSGALYSHMYVARAILCPGASIWGESAFTNPTSGTTVTKTYSYTVPVSSVPKNIRIIGLVQKYGSTTSDREIENAIEVGIMPSSPVFFAGGPSQSLSVCMNSSATSINSLLAAYDNNVGTTVNWSVLSSAVHGTLFGTTTGTSTGGIITPSGLTYAPTTGYTGNDSFKIVVADGPSLDTTTVYVTVNPLPSAIAGTLSVCVSASTTLSSTPIGGAWTCSATGIATVGSSSGTVTGVAAGTATITYTATTGCYTTAVVTVNSATSAGVISGPSTVCTGATITLTGATSGGSWSSGSTSIATVGALSGIVLGMAAGTAVITYTVTSLCGTAFSTKTVTVNTAPSAGTVSGASTVCAGSAITLTSSVSGGAWTSGSTSVATAGSSSGVVTGVTAGTAIITYTVTNACGSGNATATITVNPLPDAGVITGLDTICVGETATYTDPATGGTWTSAGSSIAVSGAGVVVGVASGIDSVKYSVTNSCGTATATRAVFVKSLTICTLEAEAGVSRSQNNVTIYPNPAKTELIINASYQVNIVTVTNLVGQTVHNQQFKARLVNMNVAQLPAGVYFIKINNTEVRKFVKE